MWATNGPTCKDTTNVKSFYYIHVVYVYYYCSKLNTLWSSCWRWIHCDLEGSVSCTVSRIGYASSRSSWSELETTCTMSCDHNINIMTDNMVHGLSPLERQRSERSPLERHKSEPLSFPQGGYPEVSSTTKIMLPTQVTSPCTIFYGFVTP